MITSLVRQLTSFKVIQQNLNILYCSNLMNMSVIWITAFIAATMCCSTYSVDQKHGTKVGSKNAPRLLPLNSRSVRTQQSLTPPLQYRRQKSWTPSSFTRQIKVLTPQKSNVYYTPETLKRLRVIAPMFAYKVPISRNLDEKFQFPQIPIAPIMSPRNHSPSPSTPKGCVINFDDHFIDHFQHLFDRSSYNVSQGGGVWKSRSCGGGPKSMHKECKTTIEELTV